MKPAAIKPEQKAAAHQVGQEIVDLIAARCEQLGIADLNVVLNILVSVFAHYIGGIGDLDVRQMVYSQVGAWLAQHLDQLEAEGAPHAEVHVERMPGRKQ